MTASLQQGIEELDAALDVLDRVKWELIDERKISVTDEQMRTAIRAIVRVREQMKALERGDEDWDDD